MKKISRVISLVISLMMAVSFSSCLLEGDGSSNDSQGAQTSVEKPGSDSGSGEEGNDSTKDDSSKDSDEKTEEGEEDEKDEEDSPTEKPDEEAKVGSVAWYLQNGYSALFNDPYMKNGLSVLSVDGAENKAIGFGTSVENPSWVFAQWHSKYDLRNYESLKYTNKGAALEISSYGAKGSDGVYIPAKVLKLDTQNPSIYMELNAELEFDKPKEDGEGWPHTLLSQDFSGELVHVCEQTEIKTHMEYAVTKFVDRMNGQADPAKHCAQLVWYVTLQNRNPESEGYGQYIWFGFNLWDNRHSGGVCPEYAAQDLGKEDATKAFIYQPASTVFFGEKRMPTVGEQTKIEFDFLPTAKQAFELAKSRGYLPQTTWEDVYIGSMNFGWEVTGIYNVGVQIDTVGIYYK